MSLPRASASLAVTNSGRGALHHLLVRTAPTSFHHRGGRFPRSGTGSSRIAVRMVNVAAPPAGSIHRPKRVAWPTFQAPCPTGNTRMGLGDLLAPGGLLVGQDEQQIDNSDYLPAPSVRGHSRRWRRRPCASAPEWGSASDRDDRVAGGVENADDFVLGTKHSRSAQRRPWAIFCSSTACATGAGPGSSRPFNSCAMAARKNILRVRSGSRRARRPRR